MTEPGTPLPDWLLERLAQGELPPAQALDAQKRLLAEPEGAARLAAVQADDAAFHASPAARGALAAIRTTAADPRAMRRWRPSLPQLSFALAAVATAAVAVVAVQPSAVAPPNPNRIKGLTPILAVYRHTGREVERLADGAQAKAGDEIQLGYTAAGRKYGAILSIDGRGGVTLHFPDRADATASELRLSQPGASAIGPVPLPRALALDDAPAFERFFLVTSPRPFDLGVVLSAAGALARDPNALELPLALPPGLDQTSLTVRKAAQ